MPKRRRKARSTKKQVAVRLDPAVHKRLLKAAADFTKSIVAIAAGGGGPKKPRRKRRKPRASK